MPKYLKERSLQVVLGEGNPLRKSLSLRLDSLVWDKIDSIAIAENRSASYVVNCLLEDAIQAIEEKGTVITTDPSALKQFRSKGNRRS